jgi:hypothetical protein
MERCTPHGGIDDGLALPFILASSDLYNCNKSGRICYLGQFFKLKKPTMGSPNTDLEPLL